MNFNTTDATLNDWQPQNGRPGKVYEVPVTRPLEETQKERAGFAFEDMILESAHLLQGNLPPYSGGYSN